MHISCLLRRAPALPFSPPPPSPLITTPDHPLTIPLASALLSLALALPRQQVVPHITDAIQDWIERVAHVPVDGSDAIPEICMIELGGTVGDIESMPFVEALR